LVMRVAYRMTLPDGRTLAGEPDGPSIRLGRDPSCEIALDETDFPMVSGLHARIEASDGGFILLHESRSNKTLLNDAVVETSHRVQSGDRVKLGYTGPTIELVSIEAASRSPQPEVHGSGQTVQADPRQLALLRGTLGTKRIEIGGGGVIGRDPQLQFPLDHPHVSRLHASLTVRGDRVVVADLRSSNGTFVNGQRLAKPVSIEAGDRIDIGPFSLRFDGMALVSRSRSNNVELSAVGLKRVVQDPAAGEPFTILDGISLVVRPHEFVCLLGPSGSGKSTLLAMLSGRSAPDEGTVLINGEDLYADFEALKADIAVVPQKDLLHETLAVEAALRYTAELRLPPDTGRDEVESIVADILGGVGLTERRATAIRYLTGGQIKRASLANELISRPSLLLLDEVTSGLDEQTDREVMSLFREVADGGKTVVCATHRLANVESTCHLVVILTRGGRLAFVGTPEEAKQYFAISRLGDLYAKLEERDPQEWHARFHASSQFQQYVAERIPTESPNRPPPIRAMKWMRSRRPSFIRQTSVLIRRYVSILRGDPQALIAMAAQGLLIAGLLGLVFGRLADVSLAEQRVQRTINLQLLLATSCFWFGANAASKELVKERAIFRHEHHLNLGVGAYFVSKMIVLAAISVIQAAVLWTIVQAWCGLPGSVLLQLLVLALLAVSGTAFGLLISALARSQEVATTLVPIVVIPQIILAGVVAPLTGGARWLAQGYVTVHWAQETLERTLPEADLALLGTSNASLSLPVMVVMSHAVIAALGTIVLLSRAGKDAQ
jgi:ABC-type multidrug transport system ATPase subunit/pSer/pThr/pTyr-binding forkhead associated (FHA) protein